MAIAFHFAKFEAPIPHCEDPGDVDRIIHALQNAKCKLQIEKFPDGPHSSF